MEVVVVVPAAREGAVDFALTWEVAAVYKHVADKSDLKTTTKEMTAMNSRTGQCSVTLQKQKGSRSLKKFDRRLFMKSALQCQ